MPARSRGFTLIEILIAVAIIGIVLSVAVLSLGLADDERAIRQEARRLMALVETAADEALFQGREFGIELAAGGYRFVEYDPVANQWASVAYDDTLRHWTLPEGMELGLWLEDKAVVLEEEMKEINYDAPPGTPSRNYAPHLLIFSSGEITPFEIRIRRLTDDRRVDIRGDLLGNLEIVEDEAAG